MTIRPRSRCFRAGSLWLPALLAACGGAEERYEIADVRTVPDEGPAVPAAITEEERFRADDPHGAAAGAPMPALARRFEFTPPDGWSELPPAPMRDHGWRLGPEGRAQCTLSLIEGAGGGLLANVNRWRQQMSLPPVGEAEVAALPTVPWLGVDARLVELDGRYVGMGGGAGLVDARLLGLVASVPAGTAFLKLTGPAGIVDVERKRFLALAASMRLREGAPRAAAPVPPPEAETPGSRPRLSWTAPKEWVAQAPRPMRLVTFSPAGSTKTTVHVTLLAGTGGGLRPNLDRWYGEMGKPPPSDAELAALPRSRVLGGDAVFVEVEGTYQGMGPAGPLPGAMLLGMVVERETGSVFVKMTGPADEVRAERERFRAFAESLRE